MKNIGSASKGNKAFNKTIIEQVKGMINDQDNYKKILDKTQMKRDQYRIFGRPAADLTQDRDPQIYNDFDFYQAILKDFLATNDSASGSSNGLNNDADDIYVDGADLGITQKFLERRRKLQEASAAQKVRKEVDRKASKNRKIRYIVHEKIVNFMTPMDNLLLQQSCDNILRSLFGQKINYIGGEV